ncbi:MAG: Anthranilate phosphoribosyltransferase [Verrucomicrobiales bacterium]|nr:Anthranilate phosphoribosyltransferase [Verrucomicrobiales bacterium]
MLNLLTTELRNGQTLSDSQIASAVADLINEQISAISKAEFLTALALKGETWMELSAFARELRKLSIAPPLDAAMREREILDVCGTGGDRLNTFNISTTVALVAAAGGVTVAKHGNRAITSSSGSADVLEELGIPVYLSPDAAARSLATHNFAFFFAQHFHPAFKHIGAARKLCAEAGQRTIFNILGPLLNPARPTAQLVGVPRPEFCEKIAHVLQSLGVRRAMVVSGEVGDAFLDEISSLGKTHLAEFYQDKGFNQSCLEPQNFPLQPATLADLQGGDKQASAKIIRNVLSGQERGPKRDAVLLNAAAAFFLAGRSRTLLDGFDYAAEVIDSGKAHEKLVSLASQPR